MIGKLPVRRAILQRQTYEAPAEGRFGKVRLDFNENTSGCSPAVLRAIQKLDAKQLAMYPEYARPVRRIAKYFEVAEQELLLTNGGDDALRVFFDTFVDPGSHILICEPTFPMYRYWAEIAGARVEALRYDQEMQFPRDKFVRSLKRRPRVAFIANPNNPTGTLLEPSGIEELLVAAPSTALVIDEAYAEFSGVNVLPLIHRYPTLFVARTFSKAAGLAGLRLGAVIANSDSIALLRRAMPPFPVNVAALVAAEAAISDRAAVRTYVQETRRRLARFSADLSKLGIQAFPSAGNFLLADFGTPGPVLFKKLAAHGILVRPRSNDMGPGFVRISIGTDAEMKKLLGVLRAELRQNSSGQSDR